MTPAKMNVLFAFFPYGGNSGIANEHPSIRRWFTSAMLEAKADERIDRVFDADFADTPITMNRNRCIQHARQVGADLIVMCDSDQWPDLYLDRDPTAKPFFKTAFDFCYAQRAKGKPVVVGAPYCGPPGAELPYVFKWCNSESNHPNADMRLEMFSREEVEDRGGIEEVAALPTGLIMFDVSVFDNVEPPYFYYEYTDEFEQEKASTEDVTCTRDISLHTIELKGYNPIHCAWDCWAGHMKPKCVGKPIQLKANQVNEKYRAVVLRNKRSDTKLEFVRSNGDLFVKPAAGYGD